MDKKGGVPACAAPRAKRSVGAQDAELAIALDEVDETHNREQEAVEEAQSKCASAAPVHVFPENKKY